MTRRGASDITHPALFPLKLLCGQHALFQFTTFDTNPAGLLSGKSCWSSEFCSAATKHRYVRNLVLNIQKNALWQRRNAKSLLDMLQHDSFTYYKTITHFIRNTKKDCALADMFYYLFPLFGLLIMSKNAGGWR